MLENGQPAPPFSLESDTGATISLESLRGRPVVIYFYPKDDTPGCTTQAVSIRDNWGEFGKIGAQVIGVSPQNAASHRKFKEKYGLPFPLLADTDHGVFDAYDVASRLSSLGQRPAVFVVDREGIVRFDSIGTQQWQIPSNDTVLAEAAKL